MAHFNSAFVTIFVLFVRASLADIPSLIERDDGLLDPLRYEVNQHGPVDFGALPLSGRSLIDSWMGKRATCTNSGYSPCTNTYGCCPTGDICCSLGCCKPSQSCCGVSYCADPGETCCTFGTCPSGFGCCGLNSCYPKSGECCANGDYCTAGNHCFLVLGVQRCCTDKHCTAHVSGTVTISATTSKAPATTSGSKITTISSATGATESGTKYIWYTYTITWYYYSYYYYLVTSTTSTYVTTTTTISIQETDSFSAYQQYLTSSSSFANHPPTPAAAFLNNTSSSTTRSSSASKVSTSITSAATVTTGTSSSQASGSHSGINWAFGSWFLLSGLIGASMLLL